MNIETEKQRVCKLNAIIDLIEYADDKLKNFDRLYDQFGTFAISRKMIHRNEITKKAKERLENYYLKQFQNKINQLQKEFA